MARVSTERPLGEITGQYDRVARFYKVFEPLYLIFPVARRKAVAALGLKPGDTVLEVGAGTGRNFPYLVDAVGPGGSVIGVDASAGMLREAGRLAERHGWANVSLLQQDAADLQLDRDVDAVLFSLSYSAMPDPRRALASAWERLRPGGRLVVMDAGLTETRLRPLLDPIARLLIRLGPGNPYSRPWDDLAEYGKVSIERFMFIYYVCSLVKPEAEKVS
jgi:demethylmenaquinone methyltransferase/2-methoxy-6-polyprenyl-1,4-benzoquinol methylase